MKGKIWLRELGTRGLGWSDAIHPPVKNWWQRWFLSLNRLKYLDFPRWVFPGESRISAIELYTFCDTSEEAYATLAYVRIIFRDSSVLVRHVKGGTKLNLPEDSFSTKIGAERCPSWS